MLKELPKRARATHTPDPPHPDFKKKFKCAWENNILPTSSVRNLQSAKCNYHPTNNSALMGLLTAMTQEQFRTIVCSDGQNMCVTT